MWPKRIILKRYVWCICIWILHKVIQNHIVTLFIYLDNCRQWNNYVDLWTKCVIHTNNITNKSKHFIYVCYNVVQAEDTPYLHGFWLLYHILNWQNWQDEKDIGLSSQKIDRRGSMHWKFNLLHTIQKQKRFGHGFETYFIQ